MITAFAGESASPEGLDTLVKHFARGDFDLIAVGRAILQDPEWVLKIKEGRRDELENFTAASFAKYY